MQVHFTCHHCGKKLKADPDRAGKRAICTRCQQPVDIPGIPERAMVPDPLSEAAAAPSSVEAERRATAQGLHEEVRATGDGPGTPRHKTTDALPLDELDDDELPDVPPPTAADLKPRSFAKDFLSPKPTPSGKPDNSYGLASMYLAAMNFLLFVAPVILGGSLAAVLGLVGIIVLYLLINIGCVYIAWKGWHLALQAQWVANTSGEGHAYAQAGRLANGLFGFLNVALVLMLVFVLVSGKSLGGGEGGGLGGIDAGGILKTLTDYKKALDGINP